MTYTNVAYANPENTTISVDISGATSFVPCAPGNSDYSRIQELVTSGELMIAAYEPAPPQPVTQITMRQCRLELLARGLLDDVEGMIAQAPRDVQIEWEYATVIERFSPLVSAIASNMTPPLSDDQIDAMFLEASKR